MSEKVTIKAERRELHLPAIALRGLVVFPNNLVHFEVGREKSIAAVEWAMANNSNVFLVAQKEMELSDPTQEDLFAYGVVAEVKQVLRVSDDLVKVLVEGKYRAKLTDLDTTGDFLLASVRPAPVRVGKTEDAVETEALLRALKSSFDEYLGMNPRLAKDVVFTIVSSTDPEFLSEYMPANLLFRYEDKQAVMNENTLAGRLQRLVEMLRRECQVMKIEKEIADKVNESMDKNQRDYYLHEQLHMISEELGEDDDTTAEAEEYRRKITALHLDEEREKKLLKEVDRLAKMQSSNQEGTVIRTYLDTCLDLPWNTFTEDDLDIAKAQRILDRDHYGLKKIKDRILEVLAVRKLAPDVKGQIICLVGPPGVGKTSIARSIAESIVVYILAWCIGDILFLGIFLCGHLCNDLLVGIGCSCCGSYLRTILVSLHSCLCGCLFRSSLFGCCGLLRIAVAGSFRRCCAVLCGSGSCSCGFFCGRSCLFCCCRNLVAVCIGCRCCSCSSSLFGNRSHVSIVVALNSVHLVFHGIFIAFLRCL